MDKNIKNLELNDAKVEIPKEEDLLEDPAKIKDSLEENLLNLESTLEATDIIVNKIEEKNDEILENIENQSFLERSQKVLENLYNKSESFILEVSKQLANYPNEVARSFRDKNIANKSQSLVKRFEKNKSLDKYYNAYKIGDLPPGKNTDNMKEKASRSFDSIYKNALPILNKIKNNDWGKSKNKEESLIGVNSLLKIIVQKGIVLERYDEIFNIINLYQKSSILTQNEKDPWTFNEIISGTGDHFYHKMNTTTDDEISKICRNDPYLIINISNKNYGEPNLDFLEKQVDRIIKEQPANSICNTDQVNASFNSVLQSNPEKYGLEPENRRAIFESFKSKGLDSSLTRNNVIFFQKELNNLSENDVKNFIDSIRYYSIKDEKNELFLANMNLQEENFKEIFDKFQRSWSEEEKPPYSKELLLEYFKKSDLPFIPFLKYKEFNLDLDSRITFLENAINKCSSENIPLFFTQILASFNNVFEGIPVEKYDSLMEKLIQRSIGGDVKKIRILHTFLPEYDIPAKYKEQINQRFSKEYSSNNSSNNNTFGKIFTEPDDSTKLSKNEEWLKGKNEIKPSLEIEFYEHGGMNDLRHFFFDVMDGKKEAADKDLLIKKYAERISEFNPEEYIDLFVIRKKIPMEYANLFIKIIGANNGHSLLSQLEDCVRLKQISDEEYNKILFDLASNGNYNFAGKSINIYLKKVEVPVAREELIENFVKNIVNQASTHNNINENDLFRIIDDSLFTENITDDERKIALNKFFEELLNYEGLHDKIIAINKKGQLFEQGFTDKKAREDFVDKLLTTKNAKTVSLLLEGYRKDIDLEVGENKDPIFSHITAEKFQTLFEKGLFLDSLSINTVLIRDFHKLSKENQNTFLQNILAKEDILKDSKNDDYSATNFCADLIDSIEDKRNKRVDSEKEPISKEDYEKIFHNIFLSPNVDDRLLGFMINQKADFLSKNKSILNGYIEKIIAKRNTKNCLETLNVLRSKEKPILLSDQVKNLSERVLTGMSIDNRIYQMYIDSTKDNLQFYIDRKIFNENIEKMSREYSDISVGDTIDFIILQEQAKNNPNLESKPLTLTKKQKEALSQNVFTKVVSTSDFEKLFSFDKKLFVNSLDSVLESKKFPMNSFTNFLGAKDEITKDAFPKIIDYFFENMKQDQHTFDLICKKYKDDPELLNQVKNKINVLPDIESRSMFKSKLLQEDLLSGEELKTFYEEIRSEPNIQSQVLLSAEVLGSLVHSGQPQKLENFLEKEGGEVKKNVEFISSFVKKYPLENKGRTIAVMLFSKEYLPERNMGEVIGKVAERLSKYERILEQYEYKGIPKGLNASIGLEYEITHSTAEGYKEATGRELKNDIVRLSKAAHIGNGADAVHEIATRPSTSPYLALLEMQSLEDLKYINLNYDYSPLYQKGARGYHLTIGGETGLSVNSNTNFLQNSILAASWGGIHVGDTGKRVSGGRGVTLRGRSAGDGHNVKVFDTPTSSVELRSLSIDKMEPFQRAVVTSFNGAIAIQALEKYTNLTSDTISEFYKSNSVVQNEKDFIQQLKESGSLKNGYDSDEKNSKIIYAWAELTSKFKDAVEYHNNEFLSGETIGYLDEDKSDVWVDTQDFGGEYNRKRFDSVVSSVDPTLSVEEYVNSTKIDFKDLFASFNGELADSLTKINNLYLKPGNKAYDKEKDITVNLGGDQANAISMLEITKLDDHRIESRTDDTYLTGTVFDTLGERREGYYYIQGGSEKMLTHACQKALLSFNKRIEEIVKN